LGAPAGTVTLAFADVVALGSVTEVGDIVQVVFAGPPLQPSATVPAKPFTPVTVSV
jgi:hypothetical protein